MSKRKQSAFTLVELLVVIGIIALLISILLPALNKARKQSREVACMNNIRQLGMGMMMYADANKGIIPYDGDPRYGNTDGDRSGRSLGWWEDPGLWINAAPYYINNKKQYSDLQLSGLPLPQSGSNSIFVCPEADLAVGSPANPAEASNGIYTMYGHPNRMNPPAVFGTNMAAGTADSTGATQVTRNAYICYGINSQLNSTTQNPGSPNKIKVVKISGLRPAGDVAMLVERRMTVNEIPVDIRTAYGSPNGNDIASRRLARIKASWVYFSARHRVGGMVCFADGHVGWMGAKDLILPPGYTTGNATFNFNQPGKLIWDPYGPSTP